MAKIRLIKTYDGKSPDDCLEAAKIAFPNSGFEIFKIRDIAWLVIAHNNKNTNLIEANISARPQAVCANVTFSINCSKLDKKALQQYLEKIISEFEKAI